MILTKAIQLVFLGFAIGLYFLFSLGQKTTLATNLTNTKSISQETTQTLPESLNLKSGVNRFLMSIPDGYYTIATVEDLKSVIDTSQPLLIDVREPSEYQSGHIPTAISIPLRTLFQSLDRIPSDRPVILYCSTGYRSAMGVMTLQLLGYNNVRGFPLSFAGWKDAGEKIAESNIRELKE